MIQSLSAASMVQQIGRVGRFKPGKAFLTTQRLKELKPPKDIIFHIISIKNAKNIQILIIKTKFKALNLVNNPKIFIESRNSLIEKIWDLPPDKKDNIPNNKKIIIMNEIKGIVKSVLLEKINIKKTKYK